MILLRAYHLVGWRIHEFLEKRLHDGMNGWRTSTILMLLQEIFLIGLIFIFESPSEANYIAIHSRAVFLVASVILVTCNMRLYFNRDLRQKFVEGFQTLPRKSVSKINKLVVAGIILDVMFLVCSFFWSVYRLKGG